MSEASEPASEAGNPQSASIQESLFRGGGCALLGVAAFFTGLSGTTATDFWWQARTGQLILENGAIPRHDPFSYTSGGERWYVHEWLTEVFFYLGYAHWGDWSLLAYRCGLTLLVAFLVFQRSRRHGAGDAAAMTATLAALMILRNYADLRPQMVSYALLAGLLLLLDRQESLPPRRLLLALPAAFAVWANLHGGVVVGLAILWIWIAGAWAEAWWSGSRRWPATVTAAALASSLAALVNPIGWNIYLYPFRVLGHPDVLGYITEWFSPNFHNPAHRAFELLLIATPAVMILAPRRRGHPAASEVLVLAALAHAALYSQRNTVLFGIAAAPVLASGLSRLWLSRQAQACPRPRFNLAPAGFAVACACLLAAVWTMRPSYSPGQWLERSLRMDRFPVAAAGRLNSGEWPGRIYNDYVWGGYLIWRLYPRRLVFVDGRAEIYYRSGAFDDEIKIHEVKQGWREALDRWKVDVVVTNRRQRLASALLADPGWQTAFVGPVEAVFTRRR